MSVVTQEIFIDVPIDRVFDVIVDYARYPEFVPGIKACRVLPTGPEKQTRNHPRQRCPQRMSSAFVD